MTKTKIHKDIIKCLKKLDIKFEDNFTIEVPNNPEHGDFSTNVALVNAKKNRKKPRILAEKITEYFSRHRDYKSVDVAGPGFINFKMANRYYHHKLLDISKTKKFGSSKHGKGKKVLLEFVSANPTGPLNVVNARAAAYGDSLYRIMSYVGFKAFREYYINDAGNQVDILAESLEIRYRELYGEKIEEFPPEAYHGEYIKDLALKLSAIDSTKLFHISEIDRLERMKNFALAELHREQVKSLERYGVEFENWMSEKKLRKEGAIEEVLSYLTEAHCTYEKDEAIWFSSIDFGDEKDRVLMKADGNTTYLVPDIAYHLTKYHRGFDIIIDVLGPDHHGHVAKLKAAIKALKLDVSKLEVVYLQHINLIQNGEVVKMSKRAGKIVSMDDLIDEVGKDAARFFFLERKPNAHLNFDLELAKKKSNENPVYYCQYAHARIHSILKKAKKEKIYLKDFDKKYLRRLNKEYELNIIKKLLEFPDTLISIADSREPHRLANYVHELAGMFHKYYAKYQIVNRNHPELSLSRLFLITAVKDVIAISLGLMGISAPKKM
ncbi:MAG TPA: arginine--tRNA ligase [Candidatus Cloacimonetes bacterium]|nr:arginine--tRNA ligase [Candidatus Cloacimonadota bacterium]